MTHTHMGLSYPIFKLYISVLKPICFGTLLIFSLSFAASAQEGHEIFRGSLYLSPGIGFGTAWGEYGDKLKMPPITISADIGIKENITVGPYLGFGSSIGTQYVDLISLEDGSGGWTYADLTYRHILAGVKGAYHVDIQMEKYGAYGGAMFGYHGISTKYKDLIESKQYEIREQKKSALSYNFFVGGKARLSPDAVAFVEAGYGVTYLNLGISLRIK